MGGAAASETLKGGYICTIGGCSTPRKQPRENPVAMYIHSTQKVLFYNESSTNLLQEMC